MYGGTQKTGQKTYQKSPKNFGKVGKSGKGEEEGKTSRTGAKGE